MFQLFGSRRRALLAAGVVCVLGVVGVGYAFGAIPGTGGVIQGCYDSGGNLKVVNALPCPKGSTALSWNQTGPTGPPGETGATGASGATGAPGPSNLAALQGSPCTVNARPSSLDVSVDSTTGVVSMVCTPVYEVKATITGGTMDLIRITRLHIAARGSRFLRRQHISVVPAAEGNVCSSRFRGRFSFPRRRPPLHVHLPKRGGVHSGRGTLVATAAPSTTGITATPTI